MSVVDELNLDDKLYIFEFLPKELEHLTKVKKIKYNTKNLKTAYLIDIVHKILVRFYFYNKRSMDLYGEILRKWYGTHYNYYINYLIEHNILTKTSNYCVGIKCNTYTLNEKFYLEECKIIRYKNDEKFLLTKWKNSNLLYELKNYNDEKIIDPWVKAKLIQDLEYVEIDYKQASKDLEEMYESNEIGFQAYYKNLLSIESIHIGGPSIFKIEDKYGRFHTNFTVLKRTIRDKHLKIDNEEVMELDIKNSQPLFLSILMKDKGINLMDEYSTNYQKFHEMVVSGNIYEYMMEGNNVTRKQCKTMIFQVFFGKNGRGIANRIFKEKFPKIFDWIRIYKDSVGDYTILSKELQGMESKLIFGQVCMKIKKTLPEVKLFTVHDSIFFAKKYEEDVAEIFYHYLDLLIA